MGSRFHTHKRGVSVAAVRPVHPVPLSLLMDSQTLARGKPTLYPILSEAADGIVLILALTTDLVHHIW